MTTYRFTYKDIRDFTKAEYTQVATTKNNDLTPDQVFSRVMMAMNKNTATCKYLLRYEVI